MKRVGNIYHEIYDMENLRIAHKNARKGKTFYKEVKMVDENPDYYLGILQKSLIEKTYKTSEYERFVKQEGKKEREIFKLPYYPDRIAQWALLQVIEPILMKNLTINTYSAIPYRGIHYGLKRLQHDLKDTHGCAYCLKFDIKKYYPSINHDLLKAKYARLIKDKDVLWLINEIIDSTDGDAGVPIGNYLSQWSGNIFLSDFDHLIKEVFKIKYYHRYMDDCVILHSSSEYLHDLRILLDEYLKSIKLEMKKDWQIFPTYTRGIDFLGYRCFGKYTLLRKTTYKAMRKKLTRILKKAQKGLINYSEYCCINAYMGWLKWCDSFRLTQKYVKPLLPHRSKYWIINIKKGVLLEDEDLYRSTIAG